MNETTSPYDFQPFPKMARLSRECVITEKIDGTNAQICITEDGGFWVGSRTRWITPEQDNFGFAKWAYENREELMALGIGRHFGEWWGQGIQRNYGLKVRRFSLFNTIRWCLHGEEPKQIQTGDPRIVKMQDVLPPCCGLVPVLHRGMFCTTTIEDCINNLKSSGSYAEPGFMNPEGIVVYHVAAGIGFKKTIVGDETPKSIR